MNGYNGESFITQAGLNNDIFDQQAFDALFMEQRGPVPPTHFKQIQKAP